MGVDRTVPGHKRAGGEEMKTVKRPGKQRADRKAGASAVWKRKTHLFRADEFVCSACGAVSKKAFGICPACGARMKNVRYDPSWVDEAEELSALLDDDW